jgi:hypothetical protein
MAAELRWDTSRLAAEKDRLETAFAAAEAR